MHVRVFLLLAWLAAAAAVNTCEFGTNEEYTFVVYGCNEGQGMYKSGHLRERTCNGWETTANLWKIVVPGSTVKLKDPTKCYTDTRSIECIDCQQGEYNPIQFNCGDWLDSCRPCPRGSKPMGTPATACEPCPAGFSSPRPGGNCQPCSAGYYTEHPDVLCWDIYDRNVACTESLCKYCPLNHYMVANRCEQCALGKSSPLASASIDACTFCIDGWGANLSDRTGCMRCKAGSYASATLTQGFCRTCPAGTQPDGKGAKCVHCDENFFSLFDVGECEECAPGKTSQAPFQMCEACHKSVPSRPTGHLSCAQCHGGYFYDETVGMCQRIPVAFIQCTPGNVIAMWYYAGLTLTDPSYVVQAFHDKLDIRYTTSEDQTTLENLEEGFYIDGDYTIKSCASADDNANYVYRDNCGPNRPLLDVWVTVGNDMTQAKNIPAGALRHFRIHTGGNRIPCTTCADHQFNSGCTANSPGVCVSCVAACSADHYLFHIKPEGCANAHAVTDTVCMPCDKITSTGDDGLSVHRIVVGCGNTPLPRWDSQTLSVDAAGPTARTCNYDTAADCFDLDGRRLIRSNNFNGRTIAPPSSIAYCPPGYFIQHQDNAQCPDDWDTVWRLACCVQCQGCPSNQKHATTFQACPGDLTTDTTLRGCTDTCSPGYFEKAEQDSAGLVSTVCTECRRGCS